MGRIIFIWFWPGLEVWYPGNTGKRSILIQLWFGNTGKTLSLIQFWTWKYWNSSHFDSVLNMEILKLKPFSFSFDPRRTVGRRGGRAAGSGDWNICERIHFRSMYPEKHWYCIYHRILTFWYFFKKDTRRNFMKSGAIFAAGSFLWDRFRPEN